MQRTEIRESCYCHLWSEKCDLNAVTVSLRQDHISYHVSSYVLDLTYRPHLKWRRQSFIRNSGEKLSI